MRTVLSYIMEAVATPIKFQKSKDFDKIQYAEKVTIKKTDYVIVVLEEKDGFACALFDPEDLTGQNISCYLSTIENVVKHFEHALKPGRTKKTAELGADGEMHYGTTTTKAALPKKLEKEIVAGKRASDAFIKYGLAPDQIYYLIKKGKKPIGLWKVPYSNYIDKTQTKADEFKICVDGVYYDDKIEYLQELTPNPLIGIQKTDKLIVLNEDVLDDKVDETDITSHIFWPDVDKVLFVIADGYFCTDGGSFIPCSFVKMEDNTLHLTKMSKMRISVDDIRLQVVPW